MSRILLASLLFVGCASLACAQPKSVGVVTLEHYEEGDSLTFFNEDGSVWLSFDPYYREDGSSFAMPEGFRPLSFHPDHFTLALRCKSLQDSMAAVVVDEEAGTVKYADIEHHTLKFESWSEHLTGLYSIGLRGDASPLHTDPDSTAEIIQVHDPNMYRLRPIEVRGDWLRVELKESGNPTEDDTRHGWVRWRDDEDRLLIALHYFS